MPPLAISIQSNMPMIALNPGWRQQRGGLQGYKSPRISFRLAMAAQPPSPAGS
jgi:hypothetical protein